MSTKEKAIPSAESPSNASVVRYRDYSADLKAEVLAALQSGTSAYSISQKTGIPQPTISLWRRKYQDDYATLCSEKSANLADIAESNAYLLGNSIANHDLEKTPLNHKATAFGIMIDKMQLLRGNPTSISTNASELAQGLAQVLAEIGKSEGFRARLLLEFGSDNGQSIK